MDSPDKRSSPLTARAREIFTAHAATGLPDIAHAILEKLFDLVNQPASAPVMQERRDAWLAFQSAGKTWLNNTHKAWRLTLDPAPLPSGAKFEIAIDDGEFKLMDNAVMENKILSSRLGLSILDVVSWELNDLRLRVQSLDKVSELQANDIFRPEVLARQLLEAWTDAGLTRDTWLATQDVIQHRIAKHLLECYHAVNEFLVQQGVMAEIDLNPLVKRTPTGTNKAPASPVKPVVSKEGRTAASASRTISSQRFGVQVRHTGGGYASNSAGSQSADGGSVGYTRHGLPTYEETRTQAAITPLGNAKIRTQGVIGGLMRLLTHQVAGFDAARAVKASPQLALALANMAKGQGSDRRPLKTAIDDQVYRAVHLDQASTELRHRTSTLKEAANTSTEKATIEIVALMFQSILAEDRIPSAIRVWFARLQIPVLRVAILEPEFFGSLQHPARRLIDRIGSCVLGFDIDVSGSTMEMEIKRIVQVIEQYPETGCKVFQLVYNEFEKFLSKFLSENGSAARVVSIAQQVEQKETMTIQYTIEMRRMLNDMPVRDEIRMFLFKTWAEVLAIAAMRNGPQHEQTLILKRCASDLVWAASAKPNRVDRAKVIADLPELLQLLRTGMTMLGMDSKTQDENIDIISNTLADAFMSKTDVISSERIDAMAMRLTNLEDYLSDEDVGHLPLDTESLVMIIGIDASDISVVTDGGSQPTEAMRAWAQELQLGSWFSLDHNASICHVQFAWRSDRKQLHLLASSDGRNFLIQAHRLAAYLQAGLLVPLEEEALTVRATRDALAKLEANPERLLS